MHPLTPYSLAISLVVGARRYLFAYRLEALPKQGRASDGEYGSQCDENTEVLREAMGTRVLSYLRPHFMKIRFGAA
jgi:hypothetical protein